MCYPIFFKTQKGTKAPALSETGGQTPLVSKESLTGRCFISATGLDGTRTTSTTLDKPLPSLEGMTGYIVFETHGGSRLSDYWQQKTKSRLTATQLSQCCHLLSRSAVSDAGVYLPSSLSFASSAVHPSPVTIKMSGAPTMSTADNMTAARQKVGSPALLGATQTATSSGTMT